MIDAVHRRPAGPAPNMANLHDAALDYLARYAATEAGLRRVLERRIDRWSRRAGDPAPETIAAARGAAAEVVARLVAAGAVNDAAFAESRARSLLRAGRSRRGAAAQLGAKGVDPATAQAALPDDAETELAAALVLARKRRIGPFRAGPAPDLAGRRRELGAMARAGFPQDVAQRALAMDSEIAETLINQFRR